VPEPDLTPEQRSRVEYVVGCVQSCENGEHKRFKERRDRLYARYRNYKDLLDEFKQTPDPDRPGLLRSSENGYGAPLSINFAFATVETTLPRMLSNRPRMLITPRGPASEQNVQNMRYLIDSQQEKINYELVLQDIAKDGLVPGLGVQKVLWRTDKRKRKMLARGVLHPLVVTEGVVTEFDGPVAERVDPIDFFGDPYASDIASPAGRVMEYAVSRSWRSTKYVLERMAQGLWLAMDGDAAKNEELVKSLDSKLKFSETQSQDPNRTQQSWGGIHEILEFHDGERLITVLDRQWLCVDMPNPYWHGELPFQLFRPTKVPGELYGIGEIEPIEDLSAEMNELRTNRRDNQRITNQQVFAYDEGVIDSADIKFGPGVTIPVNGDPRALLFPIPSRGLDNAGFQEENALLANIDRISGISDSTSGAESSVQQTATGAQLVNAAASVRIQNKTRRLEVETIKPGARHFGLLSQQMIRSTVDIRIPSPPTVDNPEARYQWLQIEPLGLQGEFEWEAEGGATAPDNVPQKRQDAQTKMGLLGTRRSTASRCFSRCSRISASSSRSSTSHRRLRASIRASCRQSSRSSAPTAERVANYVQGALQEQNQQGAPA
jgi:hypothetical protein